MIMRMWRGWTRAEDNRFLVARELRATHYKIFAST
jgi:hypothetical protein